jgi:ubiquinol-cytochrome c reductase iron-sulfur subunit
MLFRQGFRHLGRTVNQRASVLPRSFSQTQWTKFSTPVFSRGFANSIKAPDSEVEEFKQYQDETWNLYENVNYTPQDDHYEHCRIDPTQGDGTNRTYTYFWLGAGKVMYASLGRLSVMGIVATWGASAEVLARASVEVDLGGIPEGSAVTVKWRGKPIFIRHRNASQIAAAKKGDTEELRDPELDSARATRPEYIIVVGICTHLGCVPMADAGSYDAWLCPCHASHYDHSGRIRKGPAPLNLPVPPHSFLSDTLLKLG